MHTLDAKGNWTSPWHNFACPSEGEQNYEIRIVLHGWTEMTMNWDWMVAEDMSGFYDCDNLQVNGMTKPEELSSVRIHIYKVYPTSESTLGWKIEIWDGDTKLSTIVIDKHYFKPQSSFWTEWYGTDYLRPFKAPSYWGNFTFKVYIHPSGYD